MKIVFIRATSIFDDSRATKEIKALADERHVLDVLLWNRYGNAKEKIENVFGEYKNINWHFFDVSIPNGIGIKNINKLFKWFKWIKKVLNSIDNIDYIHACNLDTGIPALKYCKKKKNTKLVYDIYDYYIDSHYIPKTLVNYIEKKEIKIINFAYNVIICNEERREQIIKARPKNVTVIHNSPKIDKLEYKEIEYDYVYCGSLAKMRLINEIVLDYKNYFFLKFYFAGYGEFSETIKNVSDSNNNFIFTGPISYEKVLEIESKSRVLAAIYEPSIRNHRLCAPNKFYEALALGKPVIVCRGTGIDKIVEKYSCGIVINYNSKEFYDALLLLKEDTDLCNKMGENGRLLYEEQYSWDIMVKKLINIFN